MPTYEYECDTCKQRFETIQKMSDAPLSKCPECGRQVHRVLSPFGVSFKGSGFYITDSQKAKTPTTAKDTKPKETAAADTAKPADSKVAESKSTETT